MQYGVNNVYMQVTVLRDGEVKDISIFDLLVGDVMLFETGDIVPADGVIITGNTIRCTFMHCFHHMTVHLIASCVQHTHASAWSPAILHTIKWSVGRSSCFDSTHLHTICGIKRILVFRRLCHASMFLLAATAMKPLLHTFYQQLVTKESKRLRNPSEMMWHDMQG